MLGAGVDSGIQHQATGLNDYAFGMTAHLTGLTVDGRSSGDQRHHGQKAHRHPGKGIVLSHIHWLLPGSAARGAEYFGAPVEAMA